ncbi:MAG: glycosyltransferase [Blautia sp.]
MELPENFGFSRAVNEGIYASRTPYVLLLNNDTEVEPDFVEEMLRCIRRHENAFSCSARMIRFHRGTGSMMPETITVPWAGLLQEEKGKDIHSFEKRAKNLYRLCRRCNLSEKDIRKDRIF